MIHIVVAGATGATGRLVVEQAIEAGHEVTALLRDADRFTGPESVQLVEADVVSGRGVDLPPRIVVISAGPVLRSGAGEGGFSRWALGPLVRLWGRHIYPDLARMEERLRETGDWCRWTIIRPGYLTDRPTTGSYELAAESNVPGHARRPDLARALLTVAGDDATAGHAYGIGSR